MSSFAPLLQSRSGGSGTRPALRARLERLANAAVTPLVPADYLDLFNPLRAGAELRGRVVAVEPETADAATIVIRPGSDWAGHVPGQYVHIGVDVDGVRQWRAYSLTHGPRRDGLISVTVKAVPEGVVSNHLVHEVRVGTLVHLEQATGEFVLAPEVADGPADGPADAPADGPRAKLLFVTAGSGVTPVVGMLRNLFPATDDGVLRLPRSAHLDITVVHVAPSRPDSIFRRDLEALDAAGAIRLVARYDDEHGLLDVSRLADLVPDLGERTTYACGPGGLLDALEAHHAEAGLELFTEQFRPANLVVAEGGEVSFTRTGATVDADGATTLLDAGESAGVLMPSGCRMGVCFGCVLPLKEGSVRDLRNGEVTTAVPGEVGPEGIRIQTCITAAAGPCHIEI
ncbi:ferredoxin reductase [Nocardioides sp. ChNu-153]|uniref:ferredoxin reductase n=1 Tax=unclassified Nocardioides TaxID=2615069 RepID=UPI0024074794|nr:MULTISPECIES: ferredoxin reductase [unclassified Nocardioides]MDF9715202.1 ferredoxin reductase [Nocardioides sp. ChNu-99]MDN7121019.1 ferredoxin reductase [Nocardioides sp. ChNu-153]